MTQRILFWGFVAIFLLIGWIFAGVTRLKPRDLLQTIDQLTLERDTQARLIDHQRRFNAEIEKELEQTKKDLAQWRDNERIVREDRIRVLDELDRMALALRELDDIGRQQFNQAYERANGK